MPTPRIDPPTPPPAPRTPRHKRRLGIKHDLTTPTTRRRDAPGTPSASALVIWAMVKRAVGLSVICDQRMSIGSSELGEVVMRWVRRVGFFVVRSRTWGGVSTVRAVGGGRWTGPPINASRRALGIRFWPPTTITGIPSAPPVAVKPVHLLIFRRPPDPQDPRHLVHRQQIRNLSHDHQPPPRSYVSTRCGRPRKRALRLDPWVAESVHVLPGRGGRWPPRSR